MKVIAPLTPTRARPEFARRMVDSMLKIADNPSHIDPVFYVDNDDPEKKRYELVLSEYHVLYGARKPLGQCWNRMAKYTNADIVMMCNDDAIFRSEGWDTAIRSWDHMYRQDGIYVLYPDDMTGQGKCTFPIVSKKWIDTTGYFFPEIFEFLANDTYIERVGKEINRLFYLDMFKLEHMHFAFGKSKMDETYAHWRKSGATTRDVRLLGMNNLRIQEDAAKLQKVINEKARTDNLLST